MVLWILEYEAIPTEESKVKSTKGIKCSAEAFKSGVAKAVALCFQTLSAPHGMIHHLRISALHSQSYYEQPYSPSLML